MAYLRFLIQTYKPQYDTHQCKLYHCLQIRQHTDRYMTPQCLRTQPLRNSCARLTSIHPSLKITSNILSSEEFFVTENDGKLIVSFTHIQPSSMQIKFKPAVLLTNLVTYLSAIKLVCLTKDSIQLKLVTCLVHF